MIRGKSEKIRAKGGGGGGAKLALPCMANMAVMSPSTRAIGKPSHKLSSLFGLHCRNTRGIHCLVT